MLIYYINFIHIAYVGKRGLWKLPVQVSIHLSFTTRLYKFTNNLYQKFTFFFITDLTEETYVEYDMIRESQLILDDDDDGVDELKRHTAQPCDNVVKQRRLSFDDYSEGGVYNELRYNS